MQAILVSCYNILENYRTKKWDYIMKKVKVGVIGCGGITKATYMDNMVNMFEIIEVVGAADKIDRRAQWMADKYGIKSCTASTNPAAAQAWQTCAMRCVTVAVRVAMRILVTTQLKSSMASKSPANPARFMR